MFFKQKDPFEDKVKCYECKHWIDKSDAQVVGFTRVYSFNDRYDCKIYFCPMHKKSCDRIFQNNCTTKRYFKTIPAHEIEVDEHGKEIKKK